MNRKHPAPGLIDSEGVVSRLLGELRRSDEMTAVQAGHFMLLWANGACWPSVSVSSSADDSGSPSHRAFSEFSLRTWRAGVSLVAELIRLGQTARLLTLANDWQYLRRDTTPSAHAARAHFYGSLTAPFPTFRAILAEHQLTDDSILRISTWYPIVSETWLRRRIERRLKRLASQPRSATGLSVATRLDGTHDLVFDDFGSVCRLLVCGQSDCAGEVMELIFLLYHLGIRRLVNFIPMECALPVNEGSRRAISVFRLPDFTAINVAVPCIEPLSPDLDSGTSVRTFVVRGERHSDGRVEASVESLRRRVPDVSQEGS